jgi:hypothetical protein
MEQRNRSTLAVGLLLVIIGVAFLVLQFVPALNDWVSWPLWVIGAGVLLLLLGLLTRTPDMAVPACIVGGIGGILYYQNATGDWGSWSYVWALIPGFVGLGVIVASLLGARRESAREGLTLVIISAVLLLVFGSFFGAFRWQFWPVLLIALGVWILVQPLLRRK